MVNAIRQLSYFLMGRVRLIERIFLNRIVLALFLSLLGFACRLNDNKIRGSIGGVPHPGADSTAQLQLSQSQANLIEGQNLNFEIQISPRQNQDLWVQLSLTSSNGFNRFLPISQSVMIPSGETSLSLSISTLDDAFLQNRQEWKFVATAVIDNQTLSASELIITLDDNDGGEGGGESGSPTSPKLLGDFNLDSANIEMLRFRQNKILYQGTLASTGTELWITDGSTLGTYLLKDLETGTLSSSPKSFYFNESNQLAFFLATTSGEGLELWRSDGTAEGTYLVKDVNPGISSSNIAFKGQIGNYVLFQALVDGEGSELWVSDGSSAGTSLLVDLVPGASSPDLQGFYNYQGALYFGFGRTNVELWKTQGTPATTSLVLRTATGSGSYNINYFMEFNGELFFQGYDSSNREELWRTDGTPFGTSMVANINTAGGSVAYPRGIIANKLIFSALDSTWKHKLWSIDGSDTIVSLLPSGGFMPMNSAILGDKLIFVVSDALGVEPWVTDGTLGGTRVLKDINPTDSSVSSGQNWTTIGSLLVFPADDGTVGSEPWVSDGTTAGTFLLKDINPGSDGSSISKPIEIGNKLYFTAKSGTGRELWVTDGTTAGTHLVLDLLPGPEGSGIANLLSLDGTRLFFTAVNSAEVQPRVFISDGTAPGTDPLAHALVHSQGTSTPLLELNNSLVFQTSGEVLGSRIWSSQGSSATTNKIVEANPGSTLSFMDVRSGQLFFVEATSGIDALWKTDGSLPGTQLVKDLLSISSSILLAGFSSHLVFFNHSSTEGLEPWVSDGTNGGTLLLKDTNVGPAGIWPYASSVLTNSSQGLSYFTNSYNDSIWVTDGTSVGTADISSGFTPGYFTYIWISEFLGKSAFEFYDGFNADGELWMTDGTVGGTAKIDPGGGFRSRGLSYAQGNLIFNNLLFFEGENTASGIEPWVTDGTTAGTHILKDTEPGSGGSYVRYLGSIGSKFLFKTTAGLWASDGTTLGTEFIMAVNGVNSFFLFGGKGYFSLSNGTHGYELWQTDGTLAGTLMLSDINPGINGSSPGNFIEFNGKLYFSADDGVHGRELWETDGTPIGTKMTNDINPGKSSSSPSYFKSINGKLYFLADKVLLGNEIWVISP
jgi:ELWxxDGT repeat protein